MSKLTKIEAKQHFEAVEILNEKELTIDQKWFVVENWREDAQHVNSIAGAFFTPPGLARDLVIEITGRKVLDLCAGIGGLSFMAFHHLNAMAEITCVELNPDYIEVGKKLLPEATWIQADVFDLPDLGEFDCVISNPPFGSVKRSGNGGDYKGRKFEYHVIEIASYLAPHGVFILPQESAPFRYSGHNQYRENINDECKKFMKATGVSLEFNCGIDTDYYRDQWHGTSPATEIVLSEAPRRAASLLDLCAPKDAA